MSPITEEHDRRRDRKRTRRGEACLRPLVLLQCPIVEAKGSFCEVLQNKFLWSGEMQMKPVDQNMQYGKLNPLFEKITVGIAIVCALVAMVTALIARG